MSPQRAYQLRHRKLGLCTNCCRKAVKGEARCARHKAYNKRRCVAAYQRRLERRRWVKPKVGDCPMHPPAARYPKATVRVGERDYCRRCARWMVRAVAA